MSVGEVFHHGLTIRYEDSYFACQGGLKAAGLWMLVLFINERRGLWGEEIIA